MPKDIYARTVYGVGYIGEGKYSSQESYKKQTKLYKRWKNVLERTSDKKCKDNVITYKEATICEEWQCFQNFAEWFDEKWKPEYMNSSWHVDKDILIKGNKHYSPETCCIVPKAINSLFTRRQNDRGKYPIGVRWHTSSKKYQARVNIRSNNKHLGYFDTVEEAFQAYKVAKEAHIKEVANEWKPYVEERVYQAMYNYQVEITD